MQEQVSYDGSKWIVHTVKDGESLSKISLVYRLPNWNAIWLYNTKVRPVFNGNNPDIIKARQQIFIPRRPEGYDKLIGRLEQLKAGVSAAADKSIYELESIEWTYKAWSEMFDFAGDVATTIATFGIQARMASHAAKIAASTTGRGRVAAEYLAKREAEKFAILAKETFKAEASKAIAVKLDQLHGRHTGNETTVGQSTYKALSTGKKVINAVRSFSMEGGKFILDSADIALSFVGPTKLANAYIWATTGETVDTTLEKQRQSIRKSEERGLFRLDEMIAEAAKERHVVYPPETSRVGKYISFPPLHRNVPRSDRS